MESCFKDVVDYVTMCEVSQRRIRRRPQTEVQDNVTSLYSMEITGIDTGDPFITSKNGNNYVATVVDWY